MAFYTAAANKVPASAVNTPFFAIKAGAKRVLIWEWGLSIRTAPTAAPVWYLQRSTVVGTATSPLTPIPMDAAEGAAVSQFENAWSANPTFSTSAPFARLLGTPVTVGGAFVWTFPKPLVIAPTLSMVLANAIAVGATVGSFDSWAVWEE